MKRVTSLFKIIFSCSYCPYNLGTYITEINADYFCNCFSVGQNEGLTPEEARLLSRYGVWLIVGMCAPTADTPDEMLGRILAALCHWFNATQYLPDGE